MIKDIALIIIYSALFIYLINKVRFFKLEGISTRFLSIVFILKVFAGIALTLIYTYYYSNNETSDLHRFYKDGNILFSAFLENPLDYFKMLTGIDADTEYLKQYYTKMNNWYKAFNYDLYNDNRTLIRFNAFFRLFSFGSIYVHNIFMSFLAFIGLTGISKIFIRYYPEKKYLIAAGVYILPSVLLWTSGSLKEGINLFAFGLLFYSFFNIFNRKKVFLNLIFTLGSITILLLSKFYILIAALPGFISLIWYFLSKNNRRFYLKFIIVHVLFIIAFTFSEYIFFGYNFIEILARKQTDFINMVMSYEQAAGSYIEIPRLEPSIISIFKHTPNALFNTIFRPHFFDIHSIIVLPAFLENMIIFILILVSLVFMKKNNVSKHPGLFYFAISFSFILFTLSGLTTPIIGSLVRYKVPGLPFFILIFIILLNIDKIRKIINNRFKKLKHE